jgi:hypothetical protein
MDDYIAYLLERKVRVCINDDNSVTIKPFDSNMVSPLGKLEDIIKNTYIVKAELARLLLRDTPSAIIPMSNIDKDSKKCFNILIEANSAKHMHMIVESIGQFLMTIANDGEYDLVETEQWDKDCKTGTLTFLVSDRLSQQATDHILTLPEIKNVRTWVQPEPTWVEVS